MTDRKKPGVAFWATVALGMVLVGYPLAVAALGYSNGRWAASPGIHATRWILAPVHLLRSIAPTLTANTVDEFYRWFWRLGIEHQTDP
jgi:hypothetical protein